MHLHGGEALPNGRRTLLKTLPLLPLAAALPAPARAATARERMAFHLAEYKKAVGEIAPDLHWRVGENIGPDADTRAFAIMICADWQT